MPSSRSAKPAPFSVVKHDPPAEAVSDEYPLRLTTGRRLSAGPHRWVAGPELAEAYAALKRVPCLLEKTLPLSR